MARPGIPVVTSRPLPANSGSNFVQMNPYATNIISAPRIVNRSNSTGGPTSWLKGSSGDGGFICCFCRICTCLHVDFLRRTPGILKLSEAILGSICQWLLIDYGYGYTSDLGQSYNEFLMTSAFALTTTFLLLGCYIISKKSYYLVRSSIFETLFNLIVGLFYLSSSSYLAFRVNTILKAKYIFIPYYQVYPALTACYILGYVAAMVHLLDGFLAFRNLK